ncbi:MAG: MerR family transcriptional regulator [Clostridia bacterium]|nr:MerR family transcriptional regulator [Clostridia bacterium]
MKINQVETITGLTQKAIRLYEAKGLLRVDRSENGYRNYSERDVETLKTIKLLREAGVAIPDIKLYLCGVITLDEMVDKRKKEIEAESGKSSSQYQSCERLAGRITEGKAASDSLFTEAESDRPAEYGVLTVGIDIGTTTVSAVVYDIDNKVQIEAYSLPHHAYLRSDEYSEQSVSVILDKAEKLLRHITASYEGIVSIGVTGQMHGIVYLDDAGNPLSPLINWQDKRADLPMADGNSACERIKTLTGETVATGYGLATHYYNVVNGLVPDGATGICSIMDLFIMRVCGLPRVATHTTLAAGYGLFDVKNGCFMADKLKVLGIDTMFLPDVTSESCVVGYYGEIPVSVAIGDNLASVLGSIRDNEGSILVNIGTGSQISAIGDYCETPPELELRPFVEGKYLVCGSALCGGFAYSMLEAFFRSYAIAVGCPDEPQYKVMNELARQADLKGDAGLAVDVSFCGKRWDPHCRGSVQQIDRQNFTPSALTLGVLDGMCNELYELYSLFPTEGTQIVASGGAVRKNEVLRKRLRDRFRVPIQVNTVEEEAASGAALFAALAIGRISYDNGFSDYITY